MNRLTQMPDATVDILRDIYRQSHSVLAVIQYILRERLGDSYLGHELMVKEAFRLRVSQMAWMSWWFASPHPDQMHITDQELDAKMVPEIESRRHLWDRPACEDDLP